MFSVTSILLGNPSLAIINGRSYGEGEYLRTSRPSATKGAAPNNAIVVDPSLRVRVVRIVDGLVSLRSTDGQSLDVPMRRSELNEKKADAEEEQLLSNQ
ncbi:MAG: hypothetical protein EOP84_06345 [Verrucomicrobiaceae bacterium]|nr:MAG: hypothetical protein EOP84_06345 [Verrucomicrobiaceae bacterium]